MNPPKIVSKADKPRLPSYSEDVHQRIRAELGPAAIDEIYLNRILEGRTRPYELKAPTRPVRIEILHTLLGVELKVGNRRLLCPDLATARYLAVFARLGSDRVAIPYDITLLSSLADELDSSWHRMLLLTKHFTEGRAPAVTSRIRSRLVSDIRRRIATAGAGANYPQFAPPHSSRRRP